MPSTGAAAPVAAVEVPQDNEEVDVHVVATQASLEAAAAGEALAALPGADPALERQVEPLDRQLDATRLTNAIPAPLSKAAVSGSTPVDTLTPDELKVEKHRLQKALFKFQSDFEAAHGRKPRSAADRHGHEEHFARYKALKRQLTVTNAD